MLWPKEVRISFLQNLSSLQIVKFSGAAFKELILKINETIRPGETMRLIGIGESSWKGTLEYEYNDEIFDMMLENPKNLQAILRIAGWHPINASKPFGELNIF